MKIKNKFSFRTLILSTPPDNSLTEASQPNDTRTPTVTINTVEENFSADVLLEDNTMLSMCL